MVDIALCDGRTLVAGLTPETGGVRVVDWASGQTVLELTDPDFEHATELELSPAGTRLAVLCDTVRVVEVPSGRTLVKTGRPYYVSGFHGGFLDEQLLAVAGGGALCRFDLATGRDLVADPHAWCDDVAWARSGARYAVVRGDEVTIVDATGNAIAARIEGFDGKRTTPWDGGARDVFVHGLAFAATDTRLLVADREAVHVCDVATGKRVRSVELAGEPTTAPLAVGPDGTAALVASSRELVRIDAATGEVTSRYARDKNGFACCAWSRDGKRVAAVRMAKTPVAVAFDAKTGAAAGELKLKSSDDVLAVAITDAGSLVIATRDALLAAPRKKLLGDDVVTGSFAAVDPAAQQVLLPTPWGASLFDLHGTELARLDGVTPSSAAFLPDGGLAVVVDGGLEIYR